MTDNAWNKMWSRQRANEPWLLPDPEVEALIPRLHAECITRVLDLGCGMGRHTLLLAAAGFETHALDSSREGIERCRARLNTEGLEATTCVSSMTTLTYPEGHFGFVVSWNVVYHAVRADIVTTLAEVYRVTTKGGLLYVTLNSTRNKKSGRGSLVEPGTYDDPERERGHHLHHYSDETDARSLLSAWQIEQMAESEEWLGGRIHPGTWHWMILARKHQ